MSGADLLVRAATLMLDHANEAIPGPWETVYDGNWDDVSIRQQGHNPNIYIEVAMTQQRPTEDGPSPTAELIAACHPGFVKAVAALLNAEAIVHRSFEDGLQDLRPASPHAFTIARIFLNLEESE